MTMAIGFSMSSVNDILVDPAESAIYFELKNVRYKIIIDNTQRAEEVINIIRDILNNQKTPGLKPKHLPEFYKKL